MSNLIELIYSTGLTIYFTISNGSQFWNGTSFENYNSDHRSSYAVYLTEVSTAYYNASMPTGLATGTYSVVAYVHSGASPSGSDTAISTGNVPTIQPLPTSNSFYSYLYLLDETGTPQVNVAVTYQLMSAPTGTGSNYDTSIKNVVSDNNGLVQMPMVVGAYYQYVVNGGRVNTVFIPADATSPYPLQDATH